MNLPTPEELTKHWKQAAMTAPDDLIEQQFAQQAHMTVANKAGKLMAPPHIIGFEIISKNEENNRILGAFGFRTENILLCPVMFINGSIRGSNLLYDTKRKKFLPLCEQVVQYLIARANDDTGRGVDRSFGSRMHANYELSRIQHPGGVKLAAEMPPTPDVRDVEDLATVVGHTMSSLPRLKEMLDESFGSLGIEKLASWIETRPKLAEQFARFMDLHDLATVDGYKVDHIRKQASQVVEEPVLVVHALTLKTAAEIIALKPERAGVHNYVMEDTRKEHPRVVQIDAVQCYERPVAGRIYKAVTDRSDAEPVLCLYYTTNTFIGGVGTCVQPARYPSDSYDSDKSLVYVSKNGCVATKRIGERTDAVLLECAEEDAEKDWFKTEAAVGDLVYLVIDKLTDQQALLITSRRTDSAGITIYGFQDYPNSDEKFFRVNPDLPSLTGNVFGGDLKFVKLKPSSEDESKKKDFQKKSEFETAYAHMRPERFEVYGVSVLEDQLKTAGFIPSLLENCGSAWKLQVGTGEEQVFGDRLKVAQALADGLGISADQTEELLDKSVAEPQKFWIEKSAGALMMQNEPYFREDMDPNFGVMVQAPQHFVLRTIRNQNQFPADRIGDHAQLMRGENQAAPAEDTYSLPESQLLSREPEELLQQAEQANDPDVFEHNLIGALAGCHNGVQAMKKYAHALEEAIDALGRSLFLIYWKEADFEEHFGSDDLPDLRENLENQFLGLGKLWVQLCKRDPDFAVDQQDLRS